MDDYLELRRKQEGSHTMAQRPLRLRRASAYYRLAAKADRAGQARSASHYRDLADRLVAENRREQEYLRKIRKDQ